MIEIDKIAPINPDLIVMRYKNFKLYHFAPSLFFYRSEGVVPRSGMTPEEFVGDDREALLMALADIDKIAGGTKN